MQMLPRLPPLVKAAASPSPAASQVRLSCFPLPFPPVSGTHEGTAGKFRGVRGKAIWCRSLWVLGTRLGRAAAPNFGNMFLALQAIGLSEVLVTVCGAGWCHGKGSQQAPHQAGNHHDDSTENSGEVCLTSLFFPLFPLGLVTLPTDGKHLLSSPRPTSGTPLLRRVPSLSPRSPGDARRPCWHCAGGDGPRGAQPWRNCAATEQKGGGTTSSSSSSSLFPSRLPWRSWHPQAGAVGSALSDLASQEAGGPGRWRVMPGVPASSPAGPGEAQALPRE